MLLLGRKAKPAQKESSEEISIVKFTEKPGFDFGLVFLFMAVALALATPAFFWWGNRNVELVLVDKQAEKDKIIQQITSPSYKDIEQKAANFKAAVMQLKAASANHSAVSDFLTQFYRHITNDVQIESLALTNKSSVSFSGQTKSYRSVADLLLALGSWPVLEDVELGSVSVDVGEDGKSVASFSIKANIDPSQPLKEATKANSEEVIPVDNNALSNTLDGAGASGASQSPSVTETKVKEGNAQE